MICMEYHKPSDQFTVFKKRREPNSSLTWIRVRSKEFSAKGKIHELTATAASLITTTRATGMGEYLREQGVDEVFVVGLATDYCVHFTAADAAELGFRTIVISDATRGVNLQKGDVDRALVALQEQGVRILLSSELP